MSFFDRWGASDYYLAPFAYYWRPLHDAAGLRQGWREAARVLEQLLRSEPEDFGDAGDPQLVPFLAVAHLTPVNEWQKAGEPARAAVEFARAKEFGGPVLP